MADLSITISVPDEQLPRMLTAFRRRFRNAELTQEEMLAGLKANAISQINSVVVAEETSAIEEQKATVVPLDLT